MKTSSPNGSTQAYDPQKASIGELFSRLATDTSTLVRQEVALAKAEITQSVKSAVGVAIKLAIAGVFALLATLVLLTAAIIGLGILLGDRYWLSALIIGGVFLLLAAIFGLMGLSALKKAKLMPTQTITTLRDDAQWIVKKIKD